MTERIEWVRRGCRMLAAIAQEFERTQPFAGLVVGTGIHLEPKTVALLLTIKAGGAEVVATGNLNSTQPSAEELHGKDRLTEFDALGLLGEESSRRTISLQFASSTYTRAAPT
jgi:adenosylhomocysteinase